MQCMYGRTKPSFAQDSTCNPSVFQITEKPPCDAVVTLALFCNSRLCSLRGYCRKWPLANRHCTSSQHHSPGDRIRLLFDGDDFASCRYHISLHTIHHVTVHGQNIHCQYLPHLPQWFGISYDPPYFEERHCMCGDTSDKENH